MAKHEFTLRQNETTFCGDHYCGGHNDTYLVCSCGWETRLPDHRRPEKEDVIKTKHVLEAEGLM